MRLAVAEFGTLPEPKLQMLVLPWEVKHGVTLLFTLRPALVVPLLRVRVLNRVPAPVMQPFTEVRTRPGPLGRLAAAGGPLRKPPTTPGRLGLILTILNRPDLLTGRWTLVMANLVLDLTRRRITRLKLTWQMRLVFMTIMTLGRILLTTPTARQTVLVELRH